MDRLREMETLVAVAEAGSLAGAARQLGSSPPAVSRLIAGLEARLGVRLLNRTTRRLSLTDPGARFLEESRRILGEIAEAERQAAGEGALPRGHLTVTAPVTFGRVAVLPVVRQFLAANPRVNVSALLLDRWVGLVEEGIDAGVRIGALPDSSLIVRRVGAVRRLLVASPAYLDRAGTPQQPEDLRHHAIIGLPPLLTNGEWRHESGGKARTIRLSPRLEVSDVASAMDAALAGEGITVALSYMAAEHIRAGRLVPLLRGFEPAEIPVQLVYPQSRLIAPKLRAFLDFSAPRLSAALDRLRVPSA